MEKSQYTIKYFPKFVSQLDNIFYYFVYELKNKIVAENFYKEVFNKIEKRSYNPTAFQVFKTTKEGVNWYKINVKNFVVLYVVKNEVMEVRRIFYNKRDLNQLI